MGHLAPMQTFFEKNLICFLKIFIAKLHNILSFPDDKILQKNKRDFYKMFCTLYQAPVTSYIPKQKYHQKNA